MTFVHMPPVSSSNPRIYRTNEGVDIGAVDCEARVVQSELWCRGRHAGEVRDLPFVSQSVLIMLFHLQSKYQVLGHNHDYFLFRSIPFFTQPNHKFSRLVSPPPVPKPTTFKSRAIETQVLSPERPVHCCYMCNIPPRSLIRHESQAPTQPSTTACVDLISRRVANHYSKRERGQPSTLWDLAWSNPQKYRLCICPPQLWLRLRL